MSARHQRFKPHSVLSLKHIHSLFFPLKLTAYLLKLCFVATVQQCNTLVISVLQLARYSTEGLLQLGPLGSTTFLPDTKCLVDDGRGRTPRLKKCDAVSRISQRLWDFTQVKRKYWHFRCHERISYVTGLLITVIDAITAGIRICQLVYEWAHTSSLDRKRVRNIFHSHISRNEFAPILISAAVCTNSAQARVLTLSHRCKHDLKRLFMLQVKFLDNIQVNARLKAKKKF